MTHSKNYRKKVFIAGASSGIGRAFAILAAECGAQCVIAARRDDELDKTLSMMKGGNHRSVTIDFAERDGLELSLMRLFTEEGPFDAVVYSVGVCAVKPLAMESLESFEETIRVNCGGFWALMKAFSARGAHTDNGATAVAVSSVSANVGWSGGGAYCASKGALSALTRALNEELKTKDIRVYAIEPSHVLTSMFENCAARMGVDKSCAVSPEQVAAQILSILSESVGRRE